MTDAGRVAKKLAFVETCLRDLRTLLDPADISRDLRTERFAEHTLQIAIQAALGSAPANAPTPGAPSSTARAP